MGCDWMIPKKFLCKYKLKLGAKVFGIIMIIAMVACVIGSIVEMLTLKTCKDMAVSVKRSAYAFSVLSIIYSLIMIIMHGWFLWAINKKKASVILVWVVVTTFWLVQATVLTVVLLGLYSSDTGFVAWILCVVLGILGFVICLYGVLLGYGLWLELKAAGRVTQEGT